MNEDFSPQAGAAVYQMRRKAARPRWKRKTRERQPNEDSIILNDVVKPRAASMLQQGP
jgi:hypothetical protein